MTENRISIQKRAKRESLIRKELSKLFLDIKLSDKNLEDIFINDVKLSSDKSSAHVLFFSEKGEEYFNEKLPYIILYKPSVRKALSQILDSRYTPHIIFEYDKTLAKQAKIEALLDKIKAVEETVTSDISSDESVYPENFEKKV
jgi:ribosome-binding factor A